MYRLAKDMYRSKVFHECLAAAAISPVSNISCTATQPGHIVVILRIEFLNMLITTAGAKLHTSLGMNKPAYFAWYTKFQPALVSKKSCFHGLYKEDSQSHNKTLKIVKIPLGAF